jgi:hypothetical protein
MAWLMRHPEVVYSEMEDGAVLLNLESRFYYSLDAAGLEVWRSIEEAADVVDLRRALLARFDASEEEADARIRQFVSELQGERLVIPAEPSSSAPQASRPPSPKGHQRPPLAGPALIKHDEPLHEMSQHPFDPQLPLAE